MIRIQQEDFDIAKEIELIRQSADSIGALVSFTGIVRDLSSNQTISSMHLEHYPGMTEKVLNELDQEANKRWPLDATLIIHRYGTLLPKENIVLVITASAHRNAAFEAANFLMDKLKTNAPFWKKENTGGKDKWVEAKASDDEMSDRWGK